MVGVDTRKRKGWSGDMMVAAFLPEGPVAVTRMIYPVVGDDMLIFEADAATPGRLVRLPNGATAVLSVCYDAFALTELATGQLGRRDNMTWLATDRHKGRRMSKGEGRELLGRLDAQLKEARPMVGLIGIHRLKKPGRELLWQRHGIATASAALGGGLVVGASHFLKALPSRVGQSPLAACGVPLGHLSLGMRRTAREHAPLDGFFVDLPWAPHVRALVRLYQSA